MCCGAGCERVVQRWVSYRGIQHSTMPCKSLACVVDAQAKPQGGGFGSSMGLGSREVRAIVCVLVVAGVPFVVVLDLSKHTFRGVTATPLMGSWEEERSSVDSTGTYRKDKGGS